MNAQWRENAVVDRIIKEHGITYNVYSEDQGVTRPWKMDTLPLIFAQEEWSRLGRALSQRAELLNLIFKDAYGSQTLLTGNLLPPHLVLANPHFCRPCHGLAHYIKNPIHVYAADIARSPDGNWWVLSDRLETSTGLGYALENRFISARIFPGLMRHLKVKRLNDFIGTLCRSYENLAYLHKDQPHIVLLTPGPSNETYYEQSYLARNLGYTLVEGADLTVRENRVYLKTISVVKEVDVIIRRLDTPWCDPLELRNESILGVPGLIDVLRNRRVAIANALGVSILESAALPAFLPGLCRQLLGEELKIPSAATWWCGQPKEKTYVLENLQKLVIRQTFRKSQGQALFGSNLSESSLNELRQKIRQAPHAFSAQEMVAQATTPIYKDGSFQPRNFLMRVYLIPTNNSWEIMPGGLARIAPDIDPTNVQKDAESKDVWVIASGEENGEALKPEPVIIAPQPVRRGNFDLPSRIADNFFWLGRYVERTEGLARVLQTLLESLIDQGNDDDLSILSLFNYFLDEDETNTLTKKGSPSSLDMQSAEKQLSLLIRDVSDPGSLASNFRFLTTIATRVKERLSAQTWQQLLQLSELTGATITQYDVFDEASTQLLNDTLDLLAGFSGLMTENMTRGQNWLFLEIGKRVERTLVMIKLLYSTMKHKHDDEEEVLRKLLKCADSSMTYRRRYLTNLNANLVIDLLILEKANPRSLLFQADQILQHTKQLPHSFLESAPNKIDLISLSAFSRISLAEPQKLLEHNKEGQRKNLIIFLNHLKKDITKVATKIEQRYFAHTAPATLQ